MQYNKKVLKSDLSYLSRQDLEDMILGLASKSYNFNYLLVNFLDKTGGEQALYESALEDLKKVFEKAFKGRTAQHQEVKRLNAAAKIIQEVAVHFKNKKYEADLLLYVLKHEFSKTDLLGSKTSSYDFKIALWLKKIVALLQTKLHPDYLADYQEDVNKMLQALHAQQKAIKTIQLLAKEI